MKAPADSGFTLVEALVSLFVFSLIAAGSALLLTQSVQSQRRVAEAHEAVRELQTTRAVLAADLAQLVERGVREADASRRAHFVGGDADTPLAFVRASAEPDGVGGVITTLALVEYKFTEGGVERTSRSVLDPRAPAESSRRVLIGAADQPRFEFFDGTTWRESWLARTQGAAMPRAVALVFTSPRYGEVRVEALVRSGA